MVIYLIRNLIDGRGYVGKTIRPLGARWQKHLREDFYIDRAIRRHGIENFEICILAEVDNLPVESA